MSRWFHRAAILAVVTAGAAAWAQDKADDRGETPEANLRAAEELIARSDRYLHHDKLQRGMTGYGLTVMAGTKIEKFQATVVSVLKNWYPRQDVILCKLGGLGLDKSGIVSGMSGSPVYIIDPADGKAKMIGAVAYGWSFQNEPICGVQPIVQMLAIRGVAADRPPREDANGPPREGRVGLANTPPRDDANSPPREDPNSPPRERGVGIREPNPRLPAGAEALDPDFVRAMLDPAKVNFAALALPKRPEPARADRGRLAPLATPLMISGAGPTTIARAEKLLAGTALAPMQGGGVGGAEAEKAGEVPLEPGSGIAIPMVSGDADWAAIGTVTDVFDGKVLAFGHSFYAAGDVEMPMGPAYIHTVISSDYTSFKLGSGLPAVGTLVGDEYTGVFGRLGREAPTVPMAVTVRWGRQVKKYSYRLVRHRWYTGVMASMMLSESLYADRDLPERHTLGWSVATDFGKLGRYAVENVSSAGGDWDASSDLARPLAAMMNNELGPPVWPERIEVTLTVEEVQKTAEVLGLKLERNTYKPGETVRGTATLRPFRSARVTREVSVELPKDLPDGTYALTVCDADDAAGFRRREAPHRYDPRTVEQLFEAIRRVADLRNDRLYVYLPVGKGGLAVRKQELDRMPASLAEVLARAAPMDTAEYARSVLLDVPVEWVVRGSARASFEVRKEPERAN